MKNVEETEKVRLISTKNTTLLVRILSRLDCLELSSSTIRCNPYDCHFYAVSCQ